MDDESDDRPGNVEACSRFDIALLDFPYYVLARHNLLHGRSHIRALYDIAPDFIQFN